MINLTKKIAVIVTSLILSGQAFADVKLADVFSDNMVLQRGKPVTIWGQASPGESVKVEFSGQQQTTVTGKNGSWFVKLAPLAANSKPQKLLVTASNNQTINNILVGDVWLASGQSNMKYKTKGIIGNKDVIAKGNNPLIRLLPISQNIQKQPQTKLADKWVVSSPNNIKDFSALASIFAQGLQQELDVPIGIISAAVGSTSVEAWVSNEMLKTVNFAPAVAPWVYAEENWATQKSVFLNEKIAEHQKYIKKMKSKGKEIPPGKLQPPTQVLAPHESRLYPSGAYNGMFNPLIPMTLKGIIWRQGEANMKRGWQYQFLLADMINLWRNELKQPDLPFIQVQLPEIKRISSQPQDSSIAETRDSQYKVENKLSNVYTVVAIDLDQKGNIHPRNKKVVGERLIATTLNKVYSLGKSYSSPRYSHLEQSGNKLNVHFSNISKGLIVAQRHTGTTFTLTPTSDKPTGFAIAGKDKKFYWADAELKGNSVVLSHKDIKEPLYVRYGWADNPQGLNVYDKSGGPLMPFRTDSFPAISMDEIETKIGLIK
ncbi:sialate O-acetylesterase [Thalassotalea crassostreae]|uniref:sialate O-acetylesterase n=1 Tax=Thalassotalea crassostreae TaxID=1763536 RepID=UPI0008382B4A|nr:sialate O-acetylesterase [Thalassotalea crassostreae]